MAAAHTCTKAETIGALEATVKLQSSSLEKVDSGLKSIMSSMQEQRQEAQEQYSALDKKFVRLETLLGEAKASQLENAKVQEGIKVSIEDISTRMGKLEGRVSNHGKEIDELGDQIEQHDSRLFKIEKWIMRIAAFLAAIFVIIKGIDNVDKLRDWFVPDPPSEVAPK